MSQRGRIIRLEDSESWHSEITNYDQYDVYHLPEYQRLYTDENKEAFLLSFERNGKRASLPLMIRDLSELEFGDFSGSFDAVSCYGYPGILSNADPSGPDADTFAHAFSEWLMDTLRQRNLVSFYIRQHPLMDTAWLLQGAAEILSMGECVVIDLSLDATDIESQMRKTLRADLRKAKHRGVTVREDTNLERMDEFKEMYYTTMEEVNAAPKYFFSQQYFDALRSDLSDYTRLYFAEYGDAAVSAALFFQAGPFMQYHLSASPRSHIHHNGNKLIINHARIAGQRKSLSFLNLGGGLGSKRDSLFNFKAGYSSMTARYKTIHGIVDRELYKSLCQVHNDHFNIRGKESGYFPAYRSSEQDHQ